MIIHDNEHHVGQDNRLKTQNIINMNTFLYLFIY